MLIKRLLLFTLCFWQALLLVSCISTSTPIIPTETLTSAPLPTSTPTVIWFPPTNTPTTKPPTPIAIPTSDQRPGLDETILEEYFTDTSHWSTFRVNAGSAAFGVNELTIAAVQPKIVLSSYYQGTLPDDYYLEIVANPSLCRGDDMYGLLLRTSGEQYGYRFLINCNGQLRIDWLKAGTIIPLQDWTASGQVPPGSPVVLQIGVWIMKDEIRIFINDHYQFSVVGLTLRNGGLGLLARAAGDTALTVNFSDMVVRKISITP